METGQTFMWCTKHTAEPMVRNQPASRLFSKFVMDGELPCGSTKKPNIKSASLVAPWRCESETAKILCCISTRMCIIFESWSINLIVRVDSYVPCPFWFSKDLQEQSLWSDRLLTHYFQTFSDRQVYWTARERAKTFGDMLVVIIDSYDKCKVTLPRWAFGRTPKKPVYERVHSKLTAYDRCSFPTNPPIKTCTIYPDPCVQKMFSGICDFIITCQKWE